MSLFSCCAYDANSDDDTSSKTSIDSNHQQTPATVRPTTMEANASPSIVANYESSKPIVWDLAALLPFKA